MKVRRAASGGGYHGIESTTKPVYPQDVRTTVTLDKDVETELRRRAVRTGRSFRTVVNEVLRAGLYPRRTPHTYRLVPSSLGGAVTGIDLDRALRLADALDDAGEPQDLRTIKRS
jgi:plasmid stability protein